MKTIFFLIVALSATITYADIIQFENGGGIKASEIQQNFQELKSQAKSIKPLANFSNIVDFSKGMIIDADDFTYNFGVFSDIFDSISSFDTYNNDSIIESIIINQDFGYIKQELDLIKVLDFEPIDGPLVIHNGETYDVASGSILRFESLIIEEGGILNITGNTLNLTEIAVDGDITIDGVIQGSGYFLGSSFTGNSTLTGESLSFSISQSSGGRGGNSGVTVYSGRSQHSGNGGGGALADVPGVGGSGRHGNYASVSAPGSQTYKGGGAGGYRGEHGHSLLLVINGQVKGSGAINLSGLEGQNGQKGVNVGNSSGGGGAGAGGSAGYLSIKYFQEIDPLLSINTNGGTGGSGGSYATGAIDTTYGQYGGNGGAGQGSTPSLVPLF